MLLRTLALLAISAAGLGLHASDARPVPAGSLERGVIRSASLSLRHHSRAWVLTWLHRQPSVAGADARGHTLEIRFASGEHAFIVPPWSKAHPTVMRLPDLRAGAPAAQGGGRALVLEPFATELGPGPNAGDPEIHYLQAAGYQVDYLTDAQVTVAEMLNLPRYNVVYDRTHSINFGQGDGLVATGQPDNGDPSVLPYVHDGTVVVVNVSGTDQTFYGVTSNFISNHEGLFPPHAITFFNGCSLLLAPAFWSALQHKGVGVMVSWDGESQAVDNYLGGAAFWGEMTQGLTVQAAIAAEQQAGYGTSNQQGTVSRMGFLGDGQLTLAEAANSAPTATPPATLQPPGAPPTRVATAVPATRTPAPTAASTATAAPAPPPLTVALKRRVAPGQSQVLHIRSSPDAVLHIHVDFPNGDTRFDTTATDPGGAATFSFPQRDSKIAYNNVFARVRVDVLKDGVTATQQMTYRILWGKIDVAVSPRDQTAGNIVTIAVHTHARARVRVRLHFPNGSTKSLRGRTGARGWVLLPYSVAHSLKKGTNHTVEVTARVTLKRTWTTSTSFTIK